MELILVITKDQKQFMHLSTELVNKLYPKIYSQTMECHTEIKISEL